MEAFLGSRDFTAELQGVMAEGYVHSKSGPCVGPQEKWLW